MHIIDWWGMQMSIAQTPDKLLECWIGVVGVGFRKISFL